MTLGIWAGLAVGAVLGLTGAGGGILAVPALMFALDVQMGQAVPIALIGVGMGAAVGAVQGLFQGTVRYKAALFMAGMGSLTSPLGIAVAHHLPASVLGALFAMVLLWVAYRMFTSPGVHNAGELATPKACRIAPDTGRFIWNRNTASTLAGIGAVAGLCTGMLGVGGGFVIVPALARYSELKLHSIVSTSLAMIFLISGSTVAATVFQGLTISHAEWEFIGAVVAGMLVGRVTSKYLPALLLKRGFALVCMIVAGLMLARSMA